jgi:hypothetical protein
MAAREPFALRTATRADGERARPGRDVFPGGSSAAYRRHWAKANTTFEQTAPAVPRSTRRLPKESSARSVPICAHPRTSARLKECCFCASELADAV